MASDTPQKADDLLKQASDIVAAYVSNNSVAAALTASKLAGDWTMGTRMAWGVAMGGYFTSPRRGVRGI